MKTSTQIVTTISLKLGDSSNAIWTSAEITRYVTDAYVTLCRETLCYWKQVYLNDQAGVGECKLPTDFIEIDRATWNSKPLEIVSANRMRGMDTMYDSIEGEPVALGMDIGLVHKFRVPDTSITSTNPDVHAPTVDEVQNTRIEYFATPSLLDANMDLPESYAKALEFFALWKAYEKASPGQSIKLAQHFKFRWTEAVARFKDTRYFLPSAKIRVMGGNSQSRVSKKPQRPRMPWQYGKIVRG